MRSPLLTVFGLSLLVLTGCSTSSVRYRLTFDTQEPGQVDILEKATFRVIERRLDRLGAGIAERRITKDAEGVTVDLAISDADAAEILTEELTTPFELTFMLKTDDAANADLTVEGYGSFNETGLTGKDIETVLARSGPNGGEVGIFFTEEGKAGMREIFARNVGGELGLFVRGRLMSALTINEAEFPHPLVIDGIPDPELATVFADDVNVGLHVTVTSL